jgi:hypothetical protein
MSKTDDDEDDEVCELCGRAFASPLITRAEAARYLRIGLRTFDTHMVGVLQGIRVGRRIFYTREMLDAWLASQSPAAPPTAVMPRALARPIPLLSRTPEAKAMTEYERRREKRRQRGT